MSLEVEKPEQAETRNGSKKRLPRLDSFHVEAGKVAGPAYHGAEDDWMRTLKLAFQSIGVIYGDIGTSPLYVYSSTFTNGINNNDDILGVLSLIIYTLILLPMIKYVFIVLWANDNGDGGTFALYSLISRYAKISLIPNEQAEDAMVSNYHLESPTPELARAHWLKQKIENSTTAKIVFFLLAILGTSMVIGDGVLTPAISVLSAVGGLTEKAPSLSQNHIDWISAAILVILFSIQRFGTDKVGYSFAPIVMLWFLFIGGIGLYNLVHYDVTVLRAFNPKYIVSYFQRNGKDGWISLGGIVLCITGTEAMFADLGHFNIRAVQISFCFALFPAVTLAYIGQAAFLTKHPELVGETFYKSIPGPLFWPTFIVAVLAAIIASQAMISGAFAIISQSQTLGCFPRVRVIHTSRKYEGQVYIPELDFVLGLGCVIITFVFKDTIKIGNAYGIAVVFVMIITTLLLVVVMTVIWKISIWWIILFFLIFGLSEFIYLSSVLFKFVQGGYLPLACAFVLMTIMGIWHYVHVKKYWYELHNKVSSERLLQIAQNPNIGRIPGVGLVYSELVQGVPPLFPHLIEKIPYFHSVLLFVTVKHLPIPHVDAEERFLFRYVEPKKLRMFRCVARYGYKDELGDMKVFTTSLIGELKDYVYQESVILEKVQQRQQRGDMQHPRRSGGQSTVHIGEILKPSDTSESAISDGLTDEVNQMGDERRIIEREMEKGVVYLLGETEVVAGQRSSVFKKIVVNYLYAFLKKNFRQGDKSLSIPRDQLLKVGMAYEI